MVDIPHPIRTAQSSTLGPNQYCGGGPRGNLGCRMLFCFLSQIINMPVVFLGPGFPLLTGVFGTFLGRNRAQRCFRSHALRQYTALSRGSMALQTENTVGLPLTRKERICGEIVINVLIFWRFKSVICPSWCLAQVFHFLPIVGIFTVFSAFFWAQTVRNDVVVAMLCVSARPLHQVPWPCKQQTPFAFLWPERKEIVPRSWLTS